MTRFKFKKSGNIKIVRGETASSCKTATLNTIKFGCRVCDQPFATHDEKLLERKKLQPPFQKFSVNAYLDCSVTKYPSQPIQFVADRSRNKRKVNYPYFEQLSFGNHLVSTSSYDPFTKESSSNFFMSLFLLLDCVQSEKRRR